MNFNNSLKDSTPKTKKLSSGSSGESTTDKHKESTTQTNEEVKMDEFLDLLKVSCHVNDMITKEPQKPNLATNKVTGVRKSRLEVLHEGIAVMDFKALANNRLVNHMLAQRKKDNEAATNKGEDNEDGVTSTSSSRKQTNCRLAHAPFDCLKKPFIKSDVSKETSDGLSTELHSKLDYVINEGILDPVLPFICPVPVPKRSTRAKIKQLQKEIAHQTTEPGQGQGQLQAQTQEQEQQPKQEQSKALGVTNETAAGGDGLAVATTVKELLLPKHQKAKASEVTIHVCDEMKHTSRDFICPQNLLVSQMGYFAHITAGQALEDMDISVHCDVQIFEWLMKWVKYTAEPLNANAAQQDSGRPELDASNVVPILVSAGFLQMEPLLLECLSFFHANLNDVVRSSTNLACLNDTILTRLSAMFTNMELEAVCDKKDRLTPRLWTKLIQSLFEPEPEALRGHYFSLAGLFRCSRCGKCLTNSIKTHISCVPNNMRLNRWGQLVSYHVRDPTFDVNAYISQILKELKSWRRVYWKLWGHCHVLYCCACETHFQVYQMAWCRYHFESPNYLGPVTEGHLAGPTGRYPCCGQQAFRYETLPGPNGCQFREHSVFVSTDRERAILALSQLVGEAYALYDGPPMKLQQYVACGEVEPRWEGLSLVPPREKQGLLPRIVSEPNFRKTSRRHNYRNFSDTSTESDTSAILDSLLPAHMSCGSSNNEQSTSTDGCESDYVVTKKDIKNKPKKHKKGSSGTAGRFWSGDVSARSNQDCQREYEEKVMKQVISMVSKKTGSEHNITQSAPPLGGVYVRLETEWKDGLRHRIGTSSSNLNTNSNTNFVNPRNKIK